MHVVYLKNAMFVTLLLASGTLVAGAEDQISIDSALLQLVEQVDVPARVSGILSAVEVLEGDVVSAGAKLARLDVEESTLLYRRAAVELELSSEKARNDVSLRSAQKALSFARSEFGRVDRAATELPGSVSQSQLEEKRLKAEQAELDLEQAKHEARLNHLTEKLKKQELELGKHQIDVRQILAPVNGVVVEVVRHAGEWVEPGDKVVRIVRIDRLRAEGLIHVRHATADLKGSAATVSVTLPGSEKLQCPGEVVFVSPEVNPVNDLVRISVEFANPENRLKPGLRAKISIPSDKVGLSKPGASPAGRLAR
jgi:macrolide-specific efflux system membrane fusion protein